MLLASPVKWFFIQYISSVRCNNLFQEWGTNSWFFKELKSYQESDVTIQVSNLLGKSFQKKRYQVTNPKNKCLL